MRVCYSISYKAKIHIIQLKSVYKLNIYFLLEKQTIKLILSEKLVILFTKKTSSLYEINY